LLSGLVAVDALNASGREVEEEEAIANPQMGTSSEVSVMCTHRSRAAVMSSQD